ncbi:hypothetical protein ACFVYA_23490 [Amycolatopsis sp. NPDC058278]|uniref:hypothetical protein n=1 Tax=Amycolatopsis sp. NPDC058278 TaxID=3346417 RepID=UPI0036DD258A
MSAYAVAVGGALLPGGALLFPATLKLVSTAFAAGRQRNRAFSVWDTRAAAA